MNKFERIDMNDPRRCKGSGQYGSCPFKAVPMVSDPAPEYLKHEWSDYCPRHGANKQIIKNEKESRDLYLVAKFQERIKDGSKHPELKSLHNEIAILRMLLETKLNSLKDDFDLMAQSSGISALVSNIERTVVSANKLDEKLGSLLSKDDALTIAQRMISTIAQYIPDPDILTALSEDLVDIIKSFARDKE